MTINVMASVKENDSYTFCAHKDKHEFRLFQKPIVLVTDLH